MQFLTKKIITTVTSFILNEYKFYVDFKGMLYFQDTKQYIYPNAIKDKKFITQLYLNLASTQNYFKNKISQKQKQLPSADQQIISLKSELQKNISYPYVAEFWGQRNFVACGISPIIFLRIMPYISIENIKYSQNDKNYEFLEFSFGQYSLLNIYQICIDSQGRLWHPFIRVTHQKQNNDIKIEKTNIMGVFSNELISQMVQQIKYENNEAFLQYKGINIKISKKLEKYN